MRVNKGRFRLPLLPLIGLLLVPLAIAGLLTWSLGKPADRLQDVKAAVVNGDEPVTINGQLTPLGRQLSAKLVGGEIKSNYSWEFATPQTAADGLRSGEYAAVVTVPKNFSAAATSFSGDPAKAQRATIDVATGDRSRMADEAISRLVTDSAARLLGEQLTTTYLDNVYVGFNTLGDKLGEAAEGAGSLADGARQLSGGTGKLADGTDQLAGGSQALADGLGQLDGGAAQLAQGMNGFTEGVQQLQQQTAQLPQQTQLLAGVSQQEAQGVRQLGGGLQQLAQGLQATSAQCPLGVLPMCAQLKAEADAAKQLSEGAGKVQLASDGVSGGMQQLAGGMPRLADGIDQLAGGAQQLNGGTQQLAGGISKTSEGADQLSGGAGQLSGGMRRVADGANQLGDGSGQLAGGLGQAVDQLPKYPDGDRDKLAKAVANPVATSGGTALGFGSSGLALYAVLALWAGAAVTFLVLRAVPERALESTRSSLRLALERFRLPAVLAVAQGVLVSAIVGVAGNLSAGQWFGCAALLALVTVAFTAVNQALAAAFGGVGRFAALLVAVVLLAGGFIAAVPGAIGQISAALPVGPAQDALRAITEGLAPGGGSIALLVVWTLAGLVVSWLAVERSRTVRASSFRPAGFRSGPEPV